MNYSNWTIATLMIIALGLPGQFALAQSAQTTTAEQWSYTITQVSQAWEKSSGSKDVVVAILDNGFDHFHPDLYDNVWRNTNEIPNNGVDDDDNGYIDDVFGWDFSVIDLDGDDRISAKEAVGDNDPRPSVIGLLDSEKDIIHHGTVIAGIIGANGHNDQYASGINKQVSLMNVRVADNSGRGALEQLPKAIRYAVDNGADVINLSLVGRPGTAELTKAIDYAYEHDVMIVAAAGNSNEWLNEQPIYPVCSDTGSQKILGVSAIRKNRQAANFTNYGSDCIDITAPGVDIESTQRYAPAFGFTEAYGGGWNGTSFAAPFVSGALALVRSVQPTWSATQVYDAVLNTVHKTPPQDEAVYQELFGHGLLQIADAVQYALDGEPNIISPEEESHELPDDRVDDTSNQDGFSVYVQGDIYHYVQGDVYRTQVSSLEQSQQLTQFAVADNTFTVSIQPSATDDTVLILGDSYQLVARFSTTLRQARVIAIRPAKTLTETTLVVAGKQENGQTEAYEFTAQGLFVSQVDQSFPSGAVVISLDDTGAVVYQDKQLQWLDTKGEKRQSIELTRFERMPEIISAQLDEDAAFEYIVASADDNTNWVQYIDDDATSLRLFQPFSSSYTGYSIVATDYDGDGIDDMIVAPRTENREIRIWSSRVKRLATFPLVTTAAASAPLQLFVP